MAVDKYGVTLPRADPNRSTGLMNFAGPSDYEVREQERYKRELAAAKNKGNAAAENKGNTAAENKGNTAASLTELLKLLKQQTAASAVTTKDITTPFKEAIAGLTSVAGDVEKTYQQGKRRTLSDIAMQSVNAGMANTLNMPAAGVAYDEANRPGTNVAVAGQKAGLLSNLGQTLAGVYGTNIGSQTSLANSLLGADTSLATANIGANASLTAAQLGANTSLSIAEMDLAANQANNSLKRYLAELELKYKYGGGGNNSLVALSMGDLFG
jgi:hypothetical protein